MELFGIVNAFFNSKALKLSLRELYKYYIPVKMIDNLFHSISADQRNNEKAMQKLFNDWLKDKIEFPDLKWNTNSFNRSYKLLCDDCQMILNDKSLIDNFENIYIETDRITENKIFFENSDEYKIDNIYLKLFIKNQIIILAIICLYFYCILSIACSIIYMIIIFIVTRIILT